MDGGDLFIYNFISALPYLVTQSFLALTL